MAAVAEFTIPADQFPLGKLFESLPEARIELERVVPTTPHPIPYVWVTGVTRAAIRGLRAATPGDRAVERVRLVDELDGNYLLRLEWGPEYQGVLRGLAETDVTLVSGVGSADSWVFEVRSDGREGIAAFQEYCREHGIPLVVSALHSLSGAGGGADHGPTGAVYGLTDAQREALALAYRRGYYRSPRAVTLDELAAELGISGQAYGSRLQRGIHNLLGSTVARGRE
jgi:predicted DNA binding protein